MSVLSAKWRTFTMKCWWSYFSDFDVCWCQYCLQCEGHSPWNVGGHTSVTWDVCWCRYCLQCHGHSPWSVDGHTSVILTCDVSIVCNVKDIHHEMLVVRLQWFWHVMMSVLSAKWRTFTMKCWWSYFSDFDVCWCQYCLQCHRHSPWNGGGHTSVILQSYLVSCTVPFFFKFK